MIPSQMVVAEPRESYDGDIGRRRGARSSTSLSQGSQSRPTSGQNQHVQQKSREQWAKIWFTKLREFHLRNGRENWQFDADHVIMFLRAKLTAGMPGWKRLKIVEGLICYRNGVLKTSEPKLEPIRAKLQEIVVAEKHRDDDRPIEEILGRINPRESEVIQKMRRTMRVQRKQYNTEKAYVKWVRRFMSARSVRTFADFENVDESDVEAFLTDLAVDGNVAKSTQEQAFFALKYLLEQVLKRKLGEIDALRATKPVLVPTVMSKQEVKRVFGELTGIYLLMGKLLYGCGLRIRECLRLRIGFVLHKTRHSLGNGDRCPFGLWLRCVRVKRRRGLLALTSEHGFTIAHGLI